MTTYRFHYKPPQGGGRSAGRLFIRVIHNRRYRDIARGYTVLPCEWDPDARTVRTAVPPGERRFALVRIRECMLEDLRRIDSILTLLTPGGEFTVADICREFRRADTAGTLQGFSYRLAQELATRGQVRTARAYRSAVRRLCLFTRRDISPTEIEPGLVGAYEQHLLDSGLKMNTVSFYMRNLRAIYYRAVKAGLVAAHQGNPFAEVFTGVFETRRRALDHSQVNSLAALEKKLAHDMAQAHSCDPLHYGRLKQLRDGVNYFMFAFHCRGMSFVDLAYLKKAEVGGQTILYRRKKTGFFIEVKITRPMRAIISYFKRETKGSPYVFPIIRSQGQAARRDYESGLTRQNRTLKELAAMAGIGNGLSTHVARHTWATLAKRMGYSIPLISEGLGHRDTKVTAVYLASFERSALDELSTRLSRAVKAA